MTWQILYMIVLGFIVWGIATRQQKMREHIDKQSEVILELTSIVVGRENNSVTIKTPRVETSNRHNLN